MSYVLDAVAAGVARTGGAAGQEHPGRLHPSSGGRDGEEREDASRERAASLLSVGLFLELVVVVLVRRRGIVRLRSGSAWRVRRVRERDEASLSLEQETSFWTISALQVDRWSFNADAGEDLRLQFIKFILTSGDVWLTLRFMSSRSPVLLFFPPRPGARRVRPCGIFEH